MATRDWATLEEPNVSVTYSVECTDYGQAATFTLGPHTMTVTASSAPEADDGTITTSEGDTISGVGIEPGGANGRLAGMVGKICVDGVTVRFRSGLNLASFYPSASAPWTNTATTSHTGPSDAGYAPMDVIFKRCDPCGNICGSCLGGYLPELATLDAPFATGAACCDSAGGIYYIDMDGCDGREFYDDGGDCHWAWRITLDNLTVGVVTITAELYIQDTYPNPGVYYYWRTAIPASGYDDETGLPYIDCRTLGRLTLDYYGQDLGGLTSVCSPAGVSRFVGTQAFVEIA